MIDDAHLGRDPTVSLIGTVRWDDGVPDDYHLEPGSPCIDAGMSNGAPTTDIESARATSR